MKIRLKSLLEVLYAEHKAGWKAYEKGCQEKAEKQVSPFSYEDLHKKL